MRQECESQYNLRSFVALLVFVSLGALIILVLSCGAKAWAMPGQAPFRKTVPVQITLTVTLQRPNAPPPDPSWAVPVHMALYPPGDPGTIYKEWDLTLDTSGNWSGYQSLELGEYDVRVKNPHTLRNVKFNVNITGPTTINMGELIEGDASDNNWVKGEDFSILRTSYWKQEGQPGFDDRADFDEDGWVKGSDFSLLRTNYWTQGDIPVP
jgi:hypothetical protein